MKRILVLIKQVPATESVRLNEETGTMIRTGMDVAINPLDMHAVEQAVRFKEAAQDGCHITVLSMGPPQAQSAIREALAIGCDEGILLSGRSFAGADTWATAYTLAQGMRSLPPFDLVLCGQRATDGETGQVGPMVAAMRNVPLLTYVTKLTWEEDVITAARAIEGGTEIVSCRIPAMICVLRELNEPRLPTLSGKIRAHATDVVVWDSEAIGAEPSCIGLSGSPTRVVMVTVPSFQRSHRLCHADDEGLEAALDHLESALRTLA